MTTRTATATRTGTHGEQRQGTEMVVPTKSPTVGSPDVLNDWQPGYPPGKAYPGMTDDFEVHFSAGGKVWHRRAWRPGDRVRVVGGGVEEHEPVTILAVQTGEQPGEQKGWLTIDGRVNGYNGFPPQSLVAA